MLSPNTYKEDNKPFVNFFWHVPKAAGSFVRNVCSEGYSLKPQADLGQPNKGFHGHSDSKKHTGADSQHL